MHWEHWRLSNSSTAPPHHSHPSLFPSLPLWACRHYLMSLSFCAAGVGGGEGGCLRGCPLCLNTSNRSDSATCGHQSVSNCLIRLKILHSTFFLLSPCFSTCLMPSTGTLWDMLVGRLWDYTVIKRNLLYGGLSVPENKRQRMNRKQKEGTLSMAAVTYSLRFLSRKRFNHPAHKQPSDWLV